MVLSNGYRGWALKADSLAPFENIKDFIKEIGAQLLGPFAGAYADM